MDWSVLKEFFPNAVKIFCLLPNNDPKPLISSNLQHNFKKTLLQDSLNRWKDKLGPVNLIENLDGLQNEAFDFIYTNYIPIGHTRDLVESYKFENTKIIKIANSFDRKAWPFATHGFFRFKEQIDKLLTQLDE
jgi:deoxyribodipyrimidine photo-lyase